MSIDTINEKLALLGEHLPISSDGLDQADNQQLLWGYPGILWKITRPGELIDGVSRITVILDNDSIVSPLIDEEGRVTSVLDAVSRVKMNG